MTNDSIVARAQDLAARSGGDWADYLIAARRETNIQTLQKVVKKKSDRRDEALRKRASHAAQLRHLPGTGDPDPDRRIEIGEVETQLGRVRVAIERDSIQIHGVAAMLSEIDADLRTAIVSTSAAFAAAILDIEQTEQRAINGFVMDAVFRRHEFLSARVREAKRRERNDN
jgi:hypothetical protein